MVTVREQGQVVVLALSGRLMGGPDGTGFHQLVDTLVAEGRTKILVNLDDVNWINSTGLGILISAYTQVKKAGGHLRFCGVSERIQSILTITKLSTVFETFQNEAAAVASYDRS